MECSFQSMVVQDDPSNESTKIGAKPNIFFSQTRQKQKKSLDKALSKVFTP